jgi:hypothetical protein
MVAKRLFQFGLNSALGLNEMSWRRLAMGRTEVACYSLMASAFVLAGVWIAAAPDRLGPAAEASLVVGKETVTLMTARTRPDEEALFVLDSLRGKLLIYRLDLGKKQLELSGSADLTQIFSDQREGDSGNRSKRGR